MQLGKEEVCSLFQFVEVLFQIADTHFSFDNIMCKSSIVSCNVSWIIVLKFCQPPFVKNVNKF